MVEKIKKGTLVLLTSGEYSDYDLKAIGRATQDIDPEGLRQEWFSMHPEQADQYSAEFYAFVAWLAKSGLIEEMPCVELHLGSYGNLEPKVSSGPKLDDDE
jgi:hypothetical protein